MSYRDYSTAKGLIVDSTGHGDFTTITSALTTATSGQTIFVRPGTYTENLTLKAGVNLTAFGSDSSLNQTGTVIISGTCTMTTAGSVTISGIQLQTNSAALLAVTGSAASIVNLNNCNLNCTNNSGITYSSSSSSSAINIFSCTGNLGTTGISFFTSTGSGSISISNTVIQNLGLSTTASSTSTGLVSIFDSYITFPLSTSSVGTFILINSTVATDPINTTCLTLAGTGQSAAYLSLFGSGSASTISSGSGTTVVLDSCSVSSLNTNTITGAGRIVYSMLSYSGTTAHINTTTQNINSGSAFQILTRQVFTSSGTYTPTYGMINCDIECVGGGGGGGGTATGGASSWGIGGGGGGGGYSKKFASAVTIGTSQTVTIGAAGTAGTAGNNAGGNGGDTSVGSICIGKGATGGGGADGTAGHGVTGGAGGVAGTGDFTIPGQQGGGSYQAGTLSPTNFGGASTLGFGGAATTTSGTTAAGNAGQNYGGGGSGGISFSGSGAFAGGAGVKGVVIITEYC